MLVARVFVLLHSVLLFVGLLGGSCLYYYWVWFHISYLVPYYSFSTLVFLEPGVFRKQPLYLTSDVVVWTAYTYTPPDPMWWEYTGYVVVVVVVVIVSIQLNIKLW